MDALFGTVIKQQHFETDTFAFDVEHETDSLTFYLTDKKTGKMYASVVTNEFDGSDTLHLYRNCFFGNIKTIEINEHFNLLKVTYIDTTDVPNYFSNSGHTIFPYDKEEYARNEQKLIAYFDEQQQNIIDAINNCCFDKDNYDNIPESILIPTKDIPHTLEAIFGGVASILKTVRHRHYHPLWRKVMLLRDKLEAIVEEILLKRKEELKRNREFVANIINAMEKDKNITKAQIELLVKHHYYYCQTTKSRCYMATECYCAIPSFKIRNLELQNGSVSAGCIFQYANIFEYIISILPPPTITVGKFAKLFVDANDIYKVAKQLVAINPKFKYENLMKIYDWIDTGCIDLDCNASDDAPTCRVDCFATPERKFVHDVLQTKLDEIEFDEVLAK